MILKAFISFLQLFISHVPSKGEGKHKRTEVCVSQLQLTEFPCKLLKLREISEPKMCCLVQENCCEFSQFYN